MAAPGCVCMYAERNTWILRVLQCPWSSALPGHLLIDLDCSYGLRSRTPLRGEVWWWFLARPHLQPPSAHGVVAITLIFDFKSSWRHRAQTLFKAAYFLAHLRQNSEAVSLGLHTCAATPHSGPRSVSDVSTLIRVWSSGAVSWLTDVKVRLFPVTNSSMLPIP